MVNIIKLYKMCVKIEYLNPDSILMYEKNNPTGKSETITINPLFQKLGPLIIGIWQRLKVNALSITNALNAVSDSVFNLKPCREKYPKAKRRNRPIYRFIKVKIKIVKII